MQLTQWHRDIYEDESIGGGDPATWFDTYLEEKRPVRVWVAEVDGRVVGFTGALEDGARWELEPIVVDKAHRGSGVGSALVEALVQAARGDGRRGVFVNPAARTGTASTSSGSSS